MTAAPQIGPLNEADRAWARAYILEQWGSDVMAVSGELFHPHEHDGFVARVDGVPAGLLTYRLNPPGSFEVTSLTASPRLRGVGTALMKAAAAEARRAGCHRLWLVTTNDNVDALRFYQRRGLRMVALRPRALNGARGLKPDIPMVGNYGIPLRDEIELEMPLEPPGQASGGAATSRGPVL